MKQKIKEHLKAIRLIAFLLFFLLIFCVVNHILEDKNAKKSLYAVRYEKKNTIDVMFFGNSHANNAFLATELYNSFGYTAYNMSMMSQTYPLVYYTMMDAFKYQRPKVAVVDLYAATSYSNDFDNVHKTIDCLTFSTKIHAINEFLPEEKKFEYVFPFYLYHDRWSNLEVKDVLPYFLRYSPDRNARKGVTLVTDWAVCNNPTPELSETLIMGATCELTEENICWLERTKVLCDENNVELLLVVIPYESGVQNPVSQTVKEMQFYNAVEEWSSENQVDYFNMFTELDDMDFDFGTDMQDTSHVNILGAQKVTAEVGKYLNKNYDIPDSRSDSERAADWDGFWNSYVAERDVAIQQCMYNQKQ